MVQDALLSCGTCGEGVTVHSMKYNKTGDFLICQRCYDKEHNRASAAVVDAVHDDLEELEAGFAPTKASTTTTWQRPASTLSHVDYERNSFQCTTCGYKFSRKKGIHFNGSCPYCGKQTCESKTPVMDQPTQSGGTKVFFNVDNLLE